MKFINNSPHLHQLVPPYHRGQPKRTVAGQCYMALCVVYNSSLSSEMATHIVIFSLLWPKTSTIPLFPIKFLLLLWLLARLKPDSSTKMRLGSISLPPWPSKVLKSHDMKQQSHYSNADIHTMTTALYIHYDIWIWVNGTPVDTRYIDIWAPLSV